MARVVAALLAAGASRRLGRPKQLALHRGAPLVRLAAECLCKARVTLSAAVVGAHAGTVRQALDGLPLQVLENEHWQEGLAASIRLAVSWAERQECDGLLLALCDQPRLSTAHLDRLVDAFSRRRLAVASVYAQKKAVPALFPRASFARLAELSGDSGASPVLNGAGSVIGIPWPDGELDVDTPDAATRLLRG